MVDYRLQLANYVLGKYCVPVLITKKGAIKFKVGNNRYEIAPYIGYYCIHDGKSGRTAYRFNSQEELEQHINGYYGIFVVAPGKDERPLSSLDKEELEEMLGQVHEAAGEQLDKLSSVYCGKYYWYRKKGGYCYNPPYTITDNRNRWSMGRNDKPEAAKIKEEIKRSEVKRFVHSLLDD